MREAYGRLRELLRLQRHFALVEQHLQSRLIEYVGCEHVAIHIYHSREAHTIPRPHSATACTSKIGVHNLGESICVGPDNGHIPISRARVIVRNILLDSKPQLPFVPSFDSSGALSSILSTSFVRDDTKM